MCNGQEQIFGVVHQHQPFNQEPTGPSTYSPPAVSLKTLRRRCIVAAVLEYGVKPTRVVGISRYSDVFCVGSDMPHSKLMMLEILVSSIVALIRNSWIAVFMPWL